MKVNKYNVVSMLVVWIKYFRINLGKADEDHIENTKMFIEDIIII